MSDKQTIRQTLHLKAPGNWINDPNGFIYYQGKYHLFYQFNPYGPEWDTMHWGHAVSDDLLYWEHLGVALYPSVYEDRDGVFSGSAVEKDGKMHLFYTGIRYLDDTHTRIESAQIHLVSEDGVCFDNEHGKQVVISAFPDHPEDEGHHWNTGFPYLKNLVIGDRSDTRDPKVWRGSDGNWYMILGTTEKGRGKVLFYKSPNLEKWTPAGSCVGPEGWGWMWECPDLMFCGEQPVLIFSPMGLIHDGKHMPEQVICTPVSFQEEDCRLVLPEQYQIFDYGSDLYAPQSTIDRDGRRVLVAWLRMPEAVQPEDEDPEEQLETGGIPWNGMYCLPRVPELRDGHVCFPMHPEIRAAFQKVYTDKPFDWLREQGLSKKLLRFSVSEGETVDLGGYRITRKEGSIRTDRTAVFPDLPERCLYTQTPAIEGPVEMEAVIDSHMIELYINKGAYVISQAVYRLGDKCTFSESVIPEIFALVC